MTYNIDQMVDNTTSEFVALRNDCMWYRVVYTDLDKLPKVFNFPIPITDTLGKEFYPKMETRSLKRWLREHAQLLSNVSKTS